MPNFEGIVLAYCFALSPKSHHNPTWVMHVLKKLSATILTQVSTLLLYLKGIPKFSIAYKMQFRHLPKSKYATGLQRDILCQNAIMISCRYMRIRTTIQN
jgi:hypothetical protein